MNKEQDAYEHDLNVLRLISNPEELVPESTRYAFVKRLILRIMKVFTAYQIYFNKQLLVFLEKIIKNANLKYRIIEEELNLLKVQTLGRADNANYRSKYFPRVEEKFYLFQQERFRGSFDLIKDRQKKYIKYLKAITGMNKKNPFLEIGFGRGEFMEILQENRIKNIIGIEINKQHVIDARKRGFEVSLNDAIEFLEKQKGRLSGVSAFHVVEHMTFNQIFDLLHLIYQKMLKNGLLILETPNPENLQVGSHSFYIDHTHKTKLPARFLQSICEFIGFKSIEVIYSSPLKENLKNDVEKMIYGDFDYAIIARK
ncbi:hypothetical protein A3J15_03205 [Candidatus Roizmanbacteria bacterium RIFCSPLOWO2_02_FULL_38_10]|uniref:Methyltransferase type 11 domain-containing protein n=1 Tax=Candidatus Roizmanbacteria bacterium RIFCSPLOWO2_02_FULL_38_10 TaxID=1802074 RepID=A0A1F7JL92_9BACT|nr:MAG: hypothetical protein A3J15_03205 [Candidatus Roizmanbacteria bacterium RIFCSPLOWO2_02_FULL_38_10]